jgi:predicted Zn finger-like uncharacterized protein
MLIACTSCNSKYLVNSADLKPEGRTVQCANCGNQWYQESLVKEEVLSSSIPSSLATNNMGENGTNVPSPNLPSTYVKEQEKSIVNSILVVVFLFAIISGFWFFQKLEINSLVLVKFYIDEFYFNLKLIFADLALIIHKILN